MTYTSTFDGIRKTGRLPFIDPMVLALMRESDPKTMTRRVVKLPRWAEPFSKEKPFELRYEATRKRNWPFAMHRSTGELRAIPCPYGEAGDLVRVTETFAKLGKGKFCYRATNPELADAPPSCIKWKPPRFMPNTASRLVLDLVDVRAEWLQDISETDALAEGICEGRIDSDDFGPERIGYMVGPDDGKSPLLPTAREGFSRLWDSINGDRQYPFSSNPLVWVLTLRRCA